MPRGHKGTLTVGAGPSRFYRRKAETAKNERTRMAAHALPPNFGSHPFVLMVLSQTTISSSDKIAGQPKSIRIRGRCFGQTPRLQAIFRSKRKISGWIIPGYIFLEGIDCRRLRRNNPLPSRQWKQARSFFSVHHRKMANAPFGHHAHALTNGVVTVHGDRFRGHDVPEGVSFNDLPLR